MSKLLPINRSLAPAPGSREESTILECRLRLQESVVGGPSLKRVTDKLREYSRPESNKQTKKTHFVDLLREVELYELEIDKATRSMRMYQAEEKAYSELADGTQARVEATEKEVQQLSRRVIEEKV